MHSNHIRKKGVYKIPNLYLMNLQIWAPMGAQYTQPLVLAEWELVGEVHKEFCQLPSTQRSEQLDTVIIIKRKGFKNISQLQ